MANNQASPFDGLIDSVIIASPEGQITAINPATLNLLGYGHKQDLLGQPLRKTCKDLALEKITVNLPLPDYEMIYLDRRGREIPVHVNITMHRDHAGARPGIVFSARDMSKTRALISELTRSREKLESSYAELRDSKDAVVRSEKLAFTGRIAASIAHEIRNPLTNVIMATQQLARAVRTKEQQMKQTEMVLRNAERINYLITELLNCARPLKLNLGQGNVHELLDDVLESVKTKIAFQKIKTLRKFTFQPAALNLDKEQMERAFLNIVINAIDAMPTGGKLTLVTERRGAFFEVKIQDTGKGIPEADIIKIFDPFFSSKTGGVGLGLTTCYGIIASHHGTIEVESQLKAGTTFTVTLPV